MRTARTGSRIRPFGDAGSLVVELVLLAPVLFMFVVIGVVFGRVAEAHQQVVEASRAAAQAAAVMPSAGSARTMASVNAVVGGGGARPSCASERVVTDTTDFRPGGTVTVTVTCRVDLSDLSFPGIPGSTYITASTTAPVDPYRSVH